MKDVVNDLMCVYYTVSKWYGSKMG